ncbi:hypothetical protein BTM25_36980 [Actinomadura rubteroloni]|uniref:Flp family type IVb pilin n=1 Tax=Actinomadura rubteroloni TaxID=1926885 RepID=A0A2P4UJ49_9ACTN|nr:hypothetical protein [Actinomadura rubteroloni]POM25056.1 hypothetical protein BTM25_36980 [Actinomadura rubteroloni]
MNLSPLYATLHLFVLGRIDWAADKHRELADARRSDEGASLIEYAALIVLAAAIVAALYAAGIVDKLSTAVGSALDKIFSGGGGSSSGGNG